jgi:hypothetical protein
MAASDIISHFLFSIVRFQIFVRVAPVNRMMESAVILSLSSNRKRGKQKGMVQNGSDWSDIEENI